MTIGIQKRYIQLKTVMAAKQPANPQTATGISASVSSGKAPNCHARAAANR